MSKGPWAVGLAVAAVACFVGSIVAPRTPGPSSPSFLLAIAGIGCMLAWAYVVSAYNRDRKGWEWAPRKLGRRSSIAFAALVTAGLALAFVAPRLVGTGWFPAVRILGFALIAASVGFKVWSMAAGRRVWPNGKPGETAPGPAEAPPSAEPWGWRAVVTPAVAVILLLGSFAWSAGRDSDPDGMTANGSRLWLALDNDTVDVVLPGAGVLAPLQSAPTRAVSDPFDVPAGTQRLEVRVTGLSGDPTVTVEVNEAGSWAALDTAGGGGGVWEARAALPEGAEVRIAVEQLATAADERAQVQTQSQAEGVVWCYSTVERDWCDPAQRAS